MSNVTGTVVSVSLSTKVEKKAGGTYDAWEIVYRDSEGRIKALQKPITGLKYTKGLKEALMDLTAGDPFTAVMEMGKTGYLEVQSILKGEHTAAMAPTGASTPVSTGKVTGSNYETAAERAIRQKLIVRQSSLSNAIEYMSVSKQKMEVDDVIKLAEQFTAYVFSTEEKNND